MDEGIASQAFLLVDYVQRLERHRDGRRAVHIHLSMLKPQNRREQHVRVAANTFEELVKQFEGQIFVLGNADIVFICKDAKLADIDEAVMKLRYLFSEDPLTQTTPGDENDRFCSWYNIESQYPDFMSLAEKLHDDEKAREKRLAAAAGNEPAEPEDLRRPLAPEQLGKLEELLGRADLSSVVRRQSICAVAGDAPPQSIFKELYVSIGELAETVLPEVNLAANRWLFQHLTETLDRRMLIYLDKADDSDLFSSFSVNLNISTILSPGFLEFDASLRTGSRGTIVVELQPADVFSDINSFMFARDFLREKGYRVCLDGLNLTLFELIDRKKMGLDLVKLFWSSELSDTGNSIRRENIKAQIADLGRSRIILSRCDTPTAIRVGQSFGISMYQGRHLDSLLQGQRGPGAPQRRRAGMR